MTPLERFEQKYEPIPESGCWIWTGAMSERGYGCFMFKGKNTKAHRLSWLIHFGPIPDGLFVLHKCDNRQCVRPDHLFLGRSFENMRDMVAKGRHNPNGKKNKMHCHKGHPFSGYNLIIHSINGSRQCRKCHNERNERNKRNRQWRAS